MGFEKDWIERITFWNSPTGQELQLCMVAQGYEDTVFITSMTLYASGFAAHDIIKGLRELF